MKLPRLRMPKIPRPAKPQRIASDLVEIAGMGCLVTAAWWWLPIAGLIALGLALLLIGWVMDR